MISAGITCNCCRGGDCFKKHQESFWDNSPAHYCLLYIASELFVKVDEIVGKVYS